MTFFWTLPWFLANSEYRQLDFYNFFLLLLADAGNATRSNPLLTLFIFIGMLGFSFSLGVGFCGFERFKAINQITPKQ